MPKTDNRPVPTEAQLIEGALEALNALLPKDWKAEKRSSRLLFRSDGTGPDALLEVTSPDGVKRRIAVEAKRSALPARIREFAAQARILSDRGLQPLFVFPYVGPRARSLLRDAGVGFLDMTGALELSVDRPGLAILRTGSATNPFRVARPVRSLKGPKAGRVVRALCDWKPPRGIRELATRAEVSAGYVSRLLALLEQDALIERSIPPTPTDSAEWSTRSALERRGPVEKVDWLGLVRRWTDHYGVLTSNEVTRWLEPRGPVEFLRRVRATQRTYAVTGSAAAAATVPAVAPAQTILCFATEPKKLAAELGLREVVGAANVFLVRPLDEFVFKRSREIDRITYTAVSQTLVDLLTSPGRAAAEGEMLVEWMRRSEPAWRA